MTAHVLVECDWCGTLCVGVWAESYLCLKCFMEKDDPIPQIELGEAQLVDPTIDSKAG